MEPIVNIHSHLYPQIAAVMAFALALLPVMALALADNIVTTGQLAVAEARTDLERRVMIATALLLTETKTSSGVVMCVPEGFQGNPAPRVALPARTAAVRAA